MGKIARGYFGFKGRSAQPWEHPAEKCRRRSVLASLR